MPLNQNINEELWARAKRLADKRGQGRNWAYVMSIYKNLEKGKNKDVKKADEMKPMPPDEMFDADELKEGEQVEYEHTKDRTTARTIAKGHIKETGKIVNGKYRSKYYKKLKKMESDLKKAETLKDTINILKAAL